MRRSHPLLVAAVCACAITPPAEAASVRFYGVVHDRGVATAPAATQDQQFALMKSTGVRTARKVISWAEAQPTQGQPPTFTDTDALIARAARNDVEILPIVMYAPAWARKDPDNFVSPPRHDADYVAYLNALVARYGPSGSFWSEHHDISKHPPRNWQIRHEPQL